jgi:hypothetical protein
VGDVSRVDASEPTVNHAVALIEGVERTCASGDDSVPAEFMRSLRWRQFTELWVSERRRQLQAATGQDR